MVPSPTVLPRSASASTRLATSASTASATGAPASSCAVIGSHCAAVGGAIPRTVHHSTWGGLDRRRGGRCEARRRAGGTYDLGWRRRPFLVHRRQWVPVIHGRGNGFRWRNL